MVRPWPALLGVLIVFALDLAVAEGRRPSAGVAATIRSFVPSSLTDVEAAFARVEIRGEQLAADGRGLIPKPRYTAKIGNRFGYRNHFQGIQRVPGREYVVLSGSNPTAQTADLFVVRLGSRGAGGEEAPRVAVSRPHEGDHLAAVLAVDTALWHAGGLGMSETILVVPIYGTAPLRAKVVFYEMSDPQTPRRLPVEIDRPGRKAYAAAITRLPGGRWLTAVLSARDDLPRRLDFHLSRSVDIADGFDPAGVSWPADEVSVRNGQERTFGDFQGISFILQADGRLYLVGFHNTLPSVPFLPGRNHADLYEVVFPPATGASGTPALLKPRLIKAATRQFECVDGYCNMDAAAGLDVDAATQSLEIYAAAGWLDRDAIKFTVYRAP